MSTLKPILAGLLIAVAISLLTIANGRYAGIYPVIVWSTRP